MTDVFTPLEGVWTALISPFTDEGALDLEAWDALIRRQCEAGIRGVVVCGTTGEAPTLSVSEKLSLIKRAKAAGAGRLEIMAGSGGWNTEQTVELSKLCVEAGASSLLVVTPPYNKPPTLGLQQHYRSICEGVPSTPVVVYHVPSRTGQSLAVEQMQAVLSAHKNITAIKEASSDPALLSRYIKASSQQLSSAFTWLSGNDVSFLPEMAVGAQGVISVLSNVMPSAVQALYHAYQSADNAKATQLHHILLPLTDALFWQSNPIPTKSLLHQLGIIPSAAVRLPLATLSANLAGPLVELYHQTLEQLKQLGVTL